MQEKGKILFNPLFGHFMINSLQTSSTPSQKSTSSDKGTLFRPVVRIGFIGLGIVGQGVWKHLKSNKAVLEKRLNVEIQLVRAAVANLNKKRDVDIKSNQLTDDPMAVARDPDIDIVCELMGGVTSAKDAVLAALNSGKVVVTANKALICDHGETLFKAIGRKKNNFFFEASVAGGIPIIKSIREGLVANRFPLIYGILNGTCNYILTRMERAQKSFDAIVTEARDLGYVEADESLDLDGWDTAHKTIILAFLAHGIWAPIDQISVEGIRQIKLEDIFWAKELGHYKIKLIGRIARSFEKNKLSIQVYPALIPKSNMLSSVDEAYNAVSVTGDVVGTTSYIGKGAGQDATASAVISDIVDAIINFSHLNKPEEVHPVDKEKKNNTLWQKPELASLSDVTSEYYLRLTVADRPGVLAEIATIMAKYSISIASMRQEEKNDATASLVLTTHESNEQSMQSALKDLQTIPVIKDKPLLLRIMNV